MGLYQGMRRPALARWTRFLKIAATVAIVAAIASLSGAAGAAPSTAISYGYDEFRMAFLTKPVTPS